MKRGSDLYHTRATKDMFKGITTSQDAPSPYNLNFWIQTLVKGMDIGQSRWFDVFATNPTKAVLRTDHNGFILDVKAISNRIDAIDKLERVFVKDRCCLVKMNDIKIRWQLDAKRFGEIGKDL